MISMNDPRKLTTSERFERLYKIFKSEKFLKKEGLGNEVPFFICPFETQNTVEMQKLVPQLIKKLGNDGIHILNINLYDLSIELLKKRGKWDNLIEIEPSTPKDGIFELLQSMLDPETVLIPSMAEKMAAEPFDILFITGVGEVFPYIRSHTVLNNLQSTAKEKPTVMFFPGEYQQSNEDGSSLSLFGLLHDDKYYRAFDVYHFQAD
jgi:hypothetical protein